MVPKFAGDLVSLCREFRRGKKSTGHRHQGSKRIEGKGVSESKLVNGKNLFFWVHHPDQRTLLVYLRFVYFRCRDGIAGSIQSTADSEPAISPWVNRTCCLIVGTEERFISN